MTKKIDELVDEAMSQAEVFASAWSLVGGKFDNGEMLENAEVEKRALRALIADLLSASIADTAGAKVDGWKLVPVTPTEAMVRAACLKQSNAAFESYEAWHDSHSSGISARIRQLVASDYRVMIDAATPAPSVADAHTCAKAVLDLRDMLLRLIKYEGMAKDDATNKMYQKTTDALFAASRIKEGASSVADAAGASEGQAEPVAWMTEGKYPSPRFIIGSTDPSGVWKETYVPLYTHPSAEITAPNPDEEFCKAYAEEWQDTLKEQSDWIKARDAELTALRERIAGMEKDAGRLDFLDAINERKNKSYGTKYGWHLTENHNRIALEDHGFPVMTVRQAIDAAIAKEKQG